MVVYVSSGEFPSDESHLFIAMDLMCYFKALACGTKHLIYVVNDILLYIIPVFILIWILLIIFHPLDIIFPFLLDPWIICYWVFYSSFTKPILWHPKRLLEIYLGIRRFPLGFLSFGFPSTKTMLNYRCLVLL